jgi:hypothetical protein
LESLSVIAVKQAIELDDNKSRRHGRLLGKSRQYGVDHLCARLHEKSGPRDRRAITHVCLAGAARTEHERRGSLAADNGPTQQYVQLPVWPWSTFGPDTF